MIGHPRHGVVDRATEPAPLRRHVDQWDCRQGYARAFVHRFRSAIARGLGAVPESPAIV
jgi:hypothetical protein